jgi:hypothetical protein
MYVLTELDAQPGEWIDMGWVSRRLKQSEIHILTEEVTGKLSGYGWPEVPVPLRRDVIPRRWKNAILRVTGTTPLGFDIVFPAGVDEPVVNEVPF